MYKLLIMKEKDIPYGSIVMDVCKNDSADIKGVVVFDFDSVGIDSFPVDSLKIKNIDAISLNAVKRTENNLQEIKIIDSVDIYNNDEFDFEEFRGCAWIISAGCRGGAAYILYPHILSLLQDELKTDFYITVPNPDTLMLINKYYKDGSINTKAKECAYCGLNEESISKLVYEIVDNNVVACKNT